MEFFEVVRSRRSVRQYAPDPVDRDVLEKIVAAGIEAPSGCNKQLRQYVIVDDPAVMDRLRPVSKAIDRAAAAIVLLVEPSGTPYGEFWIQDASAAMENMLLATVALGYASCWIEGALRPSEQRVRELLAVPPELRVWAMMPVGRAAATPARPEKSEPSEVVHYNRYDS